jgi:hypothetical protein
MPTYIQKTTVIQSARYPLHYECILNPQIERLEYFIAERLLKILVPSDTAMWEVTLQPSHF